ncbi:cobalamin biosynthesis protein CbiX [Pseudorhodobacter turbinis]|uniref:Cobalamin biosynthesis protein CbiX n=1 Tax=Pseudorhodobacter turbinis TaxID=2500533 RepID=A0A4P8EGN8_9RHOB|nr:CbiX/SirB N-terminal domain-containing protein [Pseudorhodobacter turbinis]QCO56321.1 cobalamin biosynthesis protein CbiX [Pseudorhodobacter turbinis]
MTHEAILVAHGSPADPVPQEATMQALAVRVAMWLPNWRIKGTTLAMPGALEAALAATRAPLIYPFFMAEGWFTRTNLPRRLAAAHAQGLRQLAPFGTDPALPDLIAAALPQRGGVLLAAHGSKVSKTSSDTTYRMAAELEARGLGPVSAGFVEEAPFLADVAREMGSGTCMPFFALRAGHVVDDLPDALADAKFDGPLLPPIGEDIGVARLIANALARAAL